MKEYLDIFTQRRGDPTLPDLKVFFEMTESKWREIATRRMPELYQQSAVLVYYFNHLDGDGTGRIFMKFMDSTRDQMIAWESYSRQFDGYRKAMDEFLKLPGVERRGGGRFTYPSTLKPPKPPISPDGEGFTDKTGLKNLNILLAGRSLEQLQSELSEKLAKIRKGMRVQSW